MALPDLEMARMVLAAQPFSRLLGTRITAFEHGSATLELDLDDDLRQQRGFAHGGVLAYLADNAITFAAGSVLGPSVVTSGLGVEYLQPARTGPLVAVASVGHATERQAVCRVAISSPDGTCALALGRVAVVGPPYAGDRSPTGVPSTVVSS